MNGSGTPAVNGTMELGMCRHTGMASALALALASALALALTLVIYSTLSSQSHCSSMHVSELSFAVQHLSVLVFHVWSFCLVFVVLVATAFIRSSPRSPFPEPILCWVGSQYLVMASRSSLGSSLGWHLLNMSTDWLWTPLRHWCQPTWHGAVAR